VKQVLRGIKQFIYHRLGLYPIYGVLRKINSHYTLKGCTALEPFAYTGALQAVAYRKYPAYHEAWEINEWCRPHLERNLPGAVIRITDSFQEILRCDKKFNFINVDTHQAVFGNYCENFEIYPLLFRVMQNECVVNLNVIPHAGPEWRKKYPALFDEEQLARRKIFYKTDDPENVSFEQMLTTYGAIAAEYGYSITWHAFHQRTLTWYLALHLKKTK
jgi:hypothetical protein